jgi:putative NADH-flavin reductase
MHVAVFGATSPVGRSVVVKLIEQNHTVTAFEDEANPFTNHPSIRVVQGDLRNVADVARALEGADAVISTLSGGEGGIEAADASVTHTILTEMEKHGIWRVVCLSSSATIMEEDNLNFINRWICRMYYLQSPYGVGNEKDHIRFLQSSKANWTVVHTPVIRQGGKKGDWKLASDSPYPWQRVHVDDVAAALISQLSDDRYLNQAPFIRKK